MPRIEITRRAASHIERCRSFYQEIDPAVGRRAVVAIRKAFRLLAEHPASGRPVEDQPGLRELVIPFGRTGYVALYRYEQAGELVAVLAVRHRREAGYRIDD